MPVVTQHRTRYPEHLRLGRTLHLILRWDSRTRNRGVTHYPVVQKNPVDWVHSVATDSMNRVASYWVASYWVVSYWVAMVGSANRSRVTVCSEAMLVVAMAVA